MAFALRSVPQKGDRAVVRLYDRAGLSFLCRLFIAHIILFCASPKAFALEAGPNDMYVRVIDVGQGLCCVVRTPGDRYMIYDAGIGSGVNVFNEICETIPPSAIPMAIT